MKKPIYLDNMATTPIDPRVLAEMTAVYQSEFGFGNSSSSHEYGKKALELQTKARHQVADLIGALPEEIIFTSGATEANNLAIFGAARFYQGKGKHIVTIATEHDAVLAPMQALQGEGFELTILQPEKNGLLDLNKLEKALRADTILLSVMHVNNETGVIQNIKKIAEMTRQRGIIFHVDAAQSVGKITVNVRDLSVDLLSLSAHKLYGPKGIGALFISRKPRVHLKPLFYGGGQENGLRPGTLATELIVGFGYACHLAKNELSAESQRIHGLRAHFLALLGALPDWQLNGDVDARIAGNVNITIGQIQSEALIFALGELALSQTAACSIAKQTVSHVLLAMGLGEDAAKRSLRISFGRFTLLAEVEFAAALIIEQVTRLRAMLP